MEFDSFMNGIQHQIEEKQERKKRKLDKLLDGIVQKGKDAESESGAPAKNIAAKHDGDAAGAAMRLRVTRDVAESLLEGR